MNPRILSLLTSACLLAGSSAFAEDANPTFSIRAAKDGNWSDPKTWIPARVPTAGDRVLIGFDRTVTYDVRSEKVLRLVQVAGVLRFARDRDTEMNVGLLKVQNSEVCSEEGFACHFHPREGKEGEEHMPTLEIGTLESPIPAAHTARIRLHHLDGLSKEDAPAMACCSARMDIHGAPMNRTWVKLGKHAEAGASEVVLAEKVTGWRAGDEVIVTGSERRPRSGRYRTNPDARATEKRRIAKIEETTITLDKPLKYEHWGEGELRSEIANLSRNVIIESADPEGERGHTVYHRHSKGGLSYARFAHLGKENVLGRYPIHYHLCGPTMRGSSVLGVSIVDSHNRWVTVHGTQFLIVRDCVGYESVGHGFFLEDGTEAYNLLDRNLGVHAFEGRRLREQVLEFDPNEGAAFWWANGLNTLVRNVSCENDEYGFRYDMQKTSRFSPDLSVLMPNGEHKVVDVRTLPITRFENNEAHTESLYGLVVAANGNRQPDSAITTQRFLESIRRIDWTGPDVRHPHVIRNLKIWQAHYAFRPHSPSMLMENVHIEHTAYGIYRPAFEDQVYRNLHLIDIGPEPFNRGMDDASAQKGRITVDGLTIGDLRGGSRHSPVVHMTDNDLTGNAECHFRDIRILDEKGNRPVFNRGGGSRADPITETGVPYYIHDHFGPGRDAKVITDKADDLRQAGEKYRQEPPLTGPDSLIAEVGDVPFPELLQPVDDMPPTTIITSITGDKRLTVRGITHDNGEIISVTINKQKAKIGDRTAGVVDWEITIPKAKEVTAHAADKAGNIETMAHRVVVRE